MSTKQVRQQYLRFLGQLYDLASRFDPTELHEIRSVAASEGQRTVAALADALARLGEEPGSRPVLSQNVRNETIRNSSLSRQNLPLREPFLSKQLFPNNDELLSFLSPYIKIAIREKESREKLVRRIEKQVSLLSNDQRRRLDLAVHQFVERSAPSDFVSRWSKLIRSL